MSHFRIIKELNIDFMGKRFAAAVASGVVLTVFVGFMIFRGFNFGLDFTGGTMLEVGYEQPVEIAAVTAALEAGGFPAASVQYFGSRTEVLIRLLPEATGAEAASATLSDRVFATLSQGAGGKVELRRVEFVGPQVGEELREQGGLAMLFAMIGILIYVALRFEWRFALGAVAATLHDVIFTLGIFSVFWIPFDLTVLAALLAVIGYSLNDTIVIFDRVRENFRKIRKGTVLEIVNRSVNETLSRTFITAGTVLMVLVPLHFIGGEAINGFSLALIIGVLIGTYSTIYIATAVAVWLGVSRADLLATPKEGALVDDRP